MNKTKPTKNQMMMHAVVTMVALIVGMAAAALVKHPEVSYWSKAVYMGFYGVLAGQLAKKQVM